MTSREKKRYAQAILKQFGINLKQTEIRLICDTYNGVDVYLRDDTAPYFYTIHQIHVCDLIYGTIDVTDITISRYPDWVLKKVKNANGSIWRFVSDSEKRRYVAPFRRNR